MGKSKIVVGIVVLLLIAGGAYFLLTSDNSGTEEVVTLEGNVALVNGVGISQETFDSELSARVATLSAQQVDTEDPAILLQIKNQVLNDLINNELIRQNVAEAEIKISSENVDKEIKAIIDQAGSQEAFEEQLSQANLTEEQLRENISRQLAVQVYLTQNVDTSSVVVTEEEIQKFYDDSKAVQPDLPDFEEVKDEAERQLLTNKRQELLNAFLASLRADAEIETITLE